MRVEVALLGSDDRLWLRQVAHEGAHGAGVWSFLGEAAPEGSVPRDQAARHVQSLGKGTMRAHGVWQPRGDALRVPIALFSVEADQGLEPGRWWHRTELEQAWAKGELISPTVTSFLRDRELDLEAQTQAWEVVPGIRMFPVRTPTIPPATHTNTFLLGTGEAVLIEPASPYPDEIDRMARWAQAAEHEGLRLVAIIPTHHHADHVGGVVGLSEALKLPVWAHPETAAKLPIKVARHLRGGERLVLGGSSPLTLEVLHTPGHARGHLCLLEPESKVLIAGDMVAGLGTILVEPGDGDMGVYLDSLRALEALGPRRILPAHGGVIADAQGCLQRYVAHRLMREAKVLSALGSTAVAVRELVGVVYDDVPRSVWGIASLSVESHLLKLAAEGRALKVGEGWRLADP